MPEYKTQRKERLSFEVEIRRGKYDYLVCEIKQLVRFLQS